MKMIYSQANSLFARQTHLRDLKKEKSQVSLRNLDLRIEKTNQGGDICDSLLDLISWITCNKSNELGVDTTRQVR